MKRAIVFLVLFLIPVIVLIALLTARPVASSPAAPEGRGVGAAWYNPDWHYRKPITVTNTASAQTDFQVRITLDSTYDFDHTSTTGADVRFTAVDGTTDLAYWIEQWDSNARAATLWVRVPSLSAGTTNLFIYYGNSTAPAASNRRMTFTAYDGFEDYPLGSLPNNSGYSNLNPGEWSRYPTNPILQGTSGQWDAGGATFASVIYDSAASPPFRMYYHGWGGAGCSGTCIGLATSPDGQTWAKYGILPIMTPGGGWEASGVRVPMVWKEGPGDYRMIYTGSSGGVMQVGYATSADGIAWTKYALNPVFNDPNAWAHDDTQNWGVIKVGSNYLMWYQDAGGVGDPREASIATSTDLIHWTPYASTPIFSSSGDGADWRYSQFSLFTFTYAGYYYVLVPSYNNGNDYSRYYLYRSSSPYFPTNDRVLVRVAHLPGATGAWDALDGDTPMVLTLDIQRSQFYNNQLWMYYAASNAGGTWREGLLIEPDIARALYGAPIGPWGSFSWTVTIPGSYPTPTPPPAPTPTQTPAPTNAVLVANNPVRQGNQSVQLQDSHPTAAVSIRGNYAQMTQGVVALWMRRSADLTATNDDYDIYVYGDASGGNVLKAVGGLGGNARRFHYWTYVPPSRVFIDTGVTWSVNTWYLVTLTYNANTDKYDFIVYDENKVVIVTVPNIDFGYTGTYINSAMIYTGGTYVGNGFGDDYIVRKYVSPEPTVFIRATSDIQETQAISGPGTPDFSLVGITVTVTTQGNMNYLQVIRYPYSHPNSTYVPAIGGAHGTRTGRYWEVYSNDTGYTVNLTLPHNMTPDAEDKICRWTGTGQVWDCAASGYNATLGIIWRNGITQLSEWTTGNDVGPTAIKLVDLSATPVHGKALPFILVASLIVFLSVAGLVWNRFRSGSLPRK